MTTNESVIVNDAQRPSTINITKAPVIHWTEIIIVLKLEAKKEQGKKINTSKYPILCLKIHVFTIL
jgi:hypothetical protein